MRLYGTYFRKNKGCLTCWSDGFRGLHYFPSSSSSSATRHWFSFTTFTSSWIGNSWSKWICICFIHIWIESWIFVLIQFKFLGAFICWRSSSSSWRCSQSLLRPIGTVHVCCAIRLYPYLLSYLLNINLFMFIFLSSQHLMSQNRTVLESIFLTLVCR